MDTSIAESDNDDLDIYITSYSSNTEDKLVTYLKEKRVNKKVSIKIHFKFIK